MTRIATLLTTLLLGLALLLPAHAADTPASDARALGDLERGQGVFLVDIGDPGKLAFYLEVIEGTHANLLRQDVTPDFVLVYIGPSVKYLSRTPDEDALFEHHDALERIAASIARLEALGVRQEVCAVATRVFGIENDSLLPGLSLVGDGFVSLIGWQAQGYHLVPVF
ncbi:MAG: DsrE family protein [Chromatiales bacterium]|nr:DsrE family protein [Chromatiales bacterium]